MKELSTKLALEILKSYLPFIIFFIILIFLLKLPLIIKYYRSNYKTSGVNIFEFLFDKGYLGEGLTYMKLEEIPTYSKTLANVYIPTENGTTEIDIIHINKSGVYVIESKNYSGWIFGSSNNKYWTSVIYQKKYKFYNPIWQIKNHVKYLEKILTETKLISLVVFSERCELKKLNIKDEIVLKRNQLEKMMVLELEKEDILTKEEIDNIFIKLKQYSNKSKAEKQEHIKRLRGK